VPPCKPGTGDGYRDTLNWLTTIELARDNPDDQIVFVTKDADFGGRKKGPPMPQGMWDDLVTAGAERRTVILDSAQAVVDRITAEQHLEGNVVAVLGVAVSQGIERHLRDVAFPQMIGQTITARQVAMPVDAENCTITAVTVADEIKQTTVPGLADAREITVEYAANLNCEVAFTRDGQYCEPITKTLTATGYVTTDCSLQTFTLETEQLEAPPDDPAFAEWAAFDRQARSAWATALAYDAASPRQTNVAMATALGLTGVGPAAGTSVDALSSAILGIAGSQGSVSNALMKLRSNSDFGLLGAGLLAAQDPSSAADRFKALGLGVTAGVSAADHYAEILDSSAAARTSLFGMGTAAGLLADGAAAIGPVGAAAALNAGLATSAQMAGLGAPLGAAYLAATQSPAVAAAAAFFRAAGTTTAQQRPEKSRPPHPEKPAKRNRRRQPEPPKPAEVRAWARDHQIPIANAGPIPAPVMTQYLTASGADN
jgi:hypothetical protein